MPINGTSGDDSLTGSANADVFDLTQGGVDTVSGLGGDDTFEFGSRLSDKDKVDGGAGYDILVLDGGYAGGLTFKAANLVGVELLSLGAGHDYTLTIDDANASPDAFEVDASLLGVGDSLVFDGSDDTDCRLSVTGGAGDDVVIVGDGGSFLRFVEGGNDTATGGSGADDFIMGATFDTSDALDGGTGLFDSVGITGDYSAGLTVTRAMMKHIESLGMFGDFAYDIVLKDAVVAAGVVFSVTASGLAGSLGSKVDGSNESNGGFVFYGGIGDDTFKGGAGADYFQLGFWGGADKSEGGDGDDTFDFAADFSADDEVDGGGGADAVLLAGDYSAQLIIKNNMLVAVEDLQLANGFDYDLVAKDDVVAAGAVLQVSAGGLGTGDSVVFDGSAESDGAFLFYGGLGDDTFNGGDGDDTCFAVGGGGLLDGRGGDDRIDTGATDGLATVKGGDGDDVLVLGDTLTEADVIDGGDGIDILHLNGDFSAGFTFKKATLKGVEQLSLEGLEDYDLTFKDSVVIAGGVLEVFDDQFSGAADLRFDGSGEQDGSFILHGGGLGQDTLEGGHGNDEFILDGPGGNDVVIGNDGDDLFRWDQGFDTGDQADGGAGFDQIELAGLSIRNVYFLDGTMVGVEQIVLIDDYDLDIADANVAAGETLTVLGTTLSFLQNFIFVGSRELDGQFDVQGGLGNDTFTGGQGDDSLVGNDGEDSMAGEGGDDKLRGGYGDDTLAGGAGSDLLNGGIGSNTFRFAAVLESTGPAYDEITIIKPLIDHFDLDVAVTGVDSQVKVGALSAATFDADLASAVTAAKLAAAHAVVFKPDSGDLAGHTFMIVDANGAAGYQAGQDYVMDIGDSAGLNLLGTSFFI